MAGSSVSNLRSDFEIYKTQVAICGWCGAAVIVVLIGSLIYAFFLIRKLRNEFQAKMNSLEASSRYTISRPKVYSSSDPTSKLQGEMDRAVNTNYRESPVERRTPQMSPSHLGAYLNQGYPNLPSPGLNSNYSNINSPTYPNIQIRSPTVNSDGNTNRIESFLNKTRQLYDQQNEASPRLPRTPNTGRSTRDNNVFKFP